jgi:flagellar hook-associated protein 2
VLGPETDEPLTRLLSNDLHKFLNVHSASLEKYGISVNDDASLDYEKSDEITDADAIKGFGANILRKLNAISLDPMEYIDRRICAYPNPYATYPNPYVTSIYTGMLFNTYT